MKKYKIGDIYIATICRVKNYTYPNWYERITHSNQLINRCVVAMVYDHKLNKNIYITGVGVKIYGCSNDTLEIGDLFIQSKCPVGLTKAASRLPKKVTTAWMNEFQEYLEEEDNKQQNLKFIESSLIEQIIHIIEEYKSEPVEKLQLPRASGKNFSLGRISAYEDCLKLLKELLQKEKNNETNN